MGDLLGSFPKKCAINIPYKLLGHYKWYQSLASPSTVWFEDEPSGSWWACDTWAMTRARSDLLAGFHWKGHMEESNIHRNERDLETHIGKPRVDVWGPVNVPCKLSGHYMNDYHTKDLTVANGTVTCYAPEIVPINWQQMWPTSENTHLLLPPIYKTPPGRPKKLRRREADEPVSHTKLSKKHAIMKCSSCKEFGHNNTRGTSSVGGSGSRPRSEAEAPPSSSQGAAAGTASTAHSGSSLKPKLQEEQPQDWVHTISVPKPVQLDQAARRPFF
ncbi:hypothetical protein V8G54_037393 [Vigna mungo]|uniref:Uncharacterized protein n=1 Tax=Vigna mungo TaxID=3915 RepID=A0AAQ3MJ09_VIGMU